MFNMDLFYLSYPFYLFPLAFLDIKVSFIYLAIWTTGIFFETIVAYLSFTQSYFVTIRHVLYINILQLIVQIACLVPLAIFYRTIIMVKTPLLQPLVIVLIKFAPALFLFFMRYLVAYYKYMQLEPKTARLHAKKSILLMQIVSYGWMLGFIWVSSYYNVWKFM